LLTFWYINIKKVKGKECIHVTKNVREYRRGNEKKGTFKRNCQQDEEKKKKNKYVLDIIIRKQTQKT
jgi:hypothetical protein